LKKAIYIDCFSGISGDMMTAALLDLGVEGASLSFLAEELKLVDFSGYGISTSNEKRNGIAATGFKVEVTYPQHSRNFSQITELILKSRLAREVKDLSVRIFTEIANAEAKIHGGKPGEVHFHEVGAIDSIIDILSVSLLVKKLKIEKVFCSSVPLGSGTANTRHGIIPVPAPATLEILKGIPVFGGGLDFEATTPTGAAIIKTLVDEFTGIPQMTIQNTGAGAGSIISPSENSLPNILRILYGDTDKYSPENSGSMAGLDTVEKLFILSTNIDDCTAETAGYVLEKLFGAGAYDAWTEPIYMKKNRPAFKICALFGRQDLDRFLNIIFTETSSLGVRIEEITRYCLKRKDVFIDLPYGQAKAKIGYLDGKPVTYSPEFESCKDLAIKTGKPLKDIYRDLLCLLSSK
jgi:pyridinium-3,5-bisthiocarboxylic acid mononucleotide nickel chelatase